MAANAQEEVPIFDYHVISDGGPDEPTEPKPGEHWEETVWKEEPPDGNWGRGRLEGRVEIHAKGPAETPRFDAYFTFTNPPCEIKVDGEVPGRGRWRGKGKANAEGCGRKKKQIDIEFRNPKRW
jgi:hypothetical protein